MNFKRQLHMKLVAWAAVFAMLLQALMPMVSHAGAGKFSKDLVEICTSSGLQSIALDNGSRSSPAPIKNVHGDHCPYCFYAGAALLTSKNTGHPSFDVASNKEFAATTSNSNPALILAARPRGPPTNSI